MGFLLELLVIAGALFALVCLFVAPRKTLFWCSVLAGGYVLSGDGALTTAIGLAGGAVAGGILAGAFSLIAEAVKGASKLFGKAAATAPRQPSETLDPPR